jgi:hypothetical protein
MTRLAEGPRTASRSRAGLVALAAGMSVAACVYALRLDRIAGLVVDDAWYVLLGRALARGEGFRLVSSAATAIMPVVPPGFPAILAVVFRFSPDFPQNVLLLKSVSMAAMLGVGPLTYYYFTEYRPVPWQIAVGIAVATTLTPGLVFLATSTVMAESVFVFGQLLTIVIVEAASRAGDGAAGRRSIIAAAVLAAATMLVRSTALALIVAVPCYLVVKRRLTAAALFAVVTLACLLPWTIYARAHEPTEAQRLEHGGSIAHAYSDSMRMRVAGISNSGRTTLGELPAQTWWNVVNVLGRDAGGVFVPTFFRGPDESGEEVVSLGGRPGPLAGSMGGAAATMAISLVLSGFALTGYVVATRARLTAAELLVPLSLALTVAVPFLTFRYVLPLTPFLFFYLIEGVRTATVWGARALRATPRDPWRVARVVILCLIGFDLFDHAQYILHARNADRAQAVDWIGDSREIDEVLAWMKEHLPPGESVVTTNPALVYLVSGRKTLALDGDQDKWRRWKAGGLRYVVALRPLALPEPPAVFRLLYQSSRRKLWVIEL